MTYASLAFPLDLETLLEAFDAVEQDAWRLVEPLDNDAFARSPAPGGWSPSRCLDHLSRTTETYLGGLEKGFASARPRPSAGDVAIAPAAPSRWFIRMMEPPVRRRFRSPKAVRPGEARRRDEVWREFAAVNALLRAFARRCATIDLNRSRFPNPFARGLRFTIGTGLTLMLAHHRRHVVQMAEAIASTTAGRS